MGLNSEPQSKWCLVSPSPTASPTLSYGQGIPQALADVADQWAQNLEPRSPVSPSEILNVPSKGSGRPALSHLPTPP